MEAVTAFALAAGVLQVVDLSCKALANCRELYKNGSVAEYKSAEEMTKHLCKLCKVSETVGQLKATADQASGSRSQHSRDVLEISIKCSQTADELLAELKKLQPDSRGRLLQAISKSFRAIQKKDFVERIQKKLDGYQRLLDTRILAHLDAHSVRQAKDFQQLDQRVRDLVIALSQGQNTVAQLLARQSQALHDHIDQRFDKQEEANQRLKAQEHFKQSLFFPEIHARQEQISEAHRGTCRWIFHSSQHDSSTAGVSVRVDSSTNEAHAADDGGSELGVEGSQANSRQDKHGSNDYGEEQPWPNFVDWLERGQGVYWLNGKAGSGKSTLMNYIDSHSRTKETLKTWAKGSELVTTSCFFWNAGTDLQKSSQGLLRCLLYGMADQQQDLISIMMEGQASSTEEYLSSFQIPTWTNQRLMSVLRKVLVQKPLSISMCIFIDGLDEFVGDEDILIDTVRLLANTPHVKVCVSSRPEQVFREEFRGSPQLRLQDFNRKDIKKTATDRLRLPLQQYLLLLNDEFDYFVRDVSERAQGVFLWLDLVIKDIIRGVRNKDTLQELRARLDVTPGTIDGVYEYMLSRLDKLYLQESIKYFRYLVANRQSGSLERLTLLHFAFADHVPREHVLRNDLTHFETSEFDSMCQNLEIRILTRCAGLVEVEEQRDEFLDGVAGYRYRPAGDRSYFPHWRVSIAEGRNISGHLRKVDFIHRTAMDFLESHFQAFFQESNWHVATNLALARGQLGLMAILPIIMRKRDDDEDIFTISGRIENLMDLLPRIDALGNGASVNDRAIEMVDDTYRVINNVDLRLNGPRLPWREPASWSESLGSWIHEKSPFDECATFAAFFGCCSYISNYVSSRRRAQEGLNRLLLWATFGLGRFALISADVVPYLNLIEILLRQEADPNLTLISREMGGDTKEMAACGYFFKNVAPLTRGQSKNNSVGLCKKLLSAFILGGADPNTSIFSNIHIEVISDYTRPKFTAYIRLEESTLSYVKRMGVEYESLRSEELIDLLISRGAVQRRRYRAILFHDHTDPLDEKIEAQLEGFFQLSQYQSNRLGEVGEWETIDRVLDEAEPLARCLAEIRASFTESDKKDPPSFILRSSFKLENERDAERDKGRVGELS